MYKEDYAWIVRGKQRRKIIKTMNKEKIPTQIKEEANLSLNNVSDVLRAFKKRKIAKCLNPKMKTGRLYKLTPKGRRIREMLES
jgi:predicted transcriptional regulator